MTSSSDADERAVLLEARDIVVHYGRIEALHGVSVVVREGEAGDNARRERRRKDHYDEPFRACDRCPRARSGSMERIPRVIAPPGRRRADPGAGGPPGLLRHDLSDNLEGRYGRKFASKAEHNERLERVLGDFPRWPNGETRGRHAVRRRAADAGDRPRTMARPRVLLLDEPSLGLAPIVISQIFRSSARSTRRAPRCCSSSRTRSRR